MTQHAPQHEIVVRYVRTDSLAHRTKLAAAEHVLSADERDQLARFTSTRTQYDYLAASALARMTLAEFTDCDPRRLQFREGRHGRRRVSRPWRARSMEFSVSHADGLAVCAVSRGCAIGVDVESGRQLGRDPMGVASAVCSEGEHESLRQLPQALRAERVLAVWTQKEAVAQATGPETQMSLSAIHVEDVRAMGTNPGAFGVSVEGADHSRWRLTTLRLAPHYVAAVAVPERFIDRVAVRLEEGHVGANLFTAWPTS